MKYGNWTIRTAREEAIEDLMRGGYSPLSALALASRGMDSAEKANKFLLNDISDMHDPFLLKDMDRAARRIRRALESGEKIAVYGDYDVDGITSTCLLVRYLRSEGADCTYYIPGRIEEGYGLNVSAIGELARGGVSLIITVDCGITAVEEARFAAAAGVDIIITDHHRCMETLPEAIAVVDPFRADSEYPFDRLAGVGVAFKLVCALAGADRAMEYCDLAALGTVADIMPLEDENRVIAKYGLKKMEKDTCPGLRSLMREIGVKDGKINAVNIGYGLAPRINAAGRMEKAGIAARLLLTEDAAEADELAATLCELNRKRQEIENGIYIHAKRLLGDRGPGGAIVLAEEGWHQGVVGIVSSRLAEEYRGRVFLIALDGDTGKASCRGFGGLSVISALKAASEYLEEYGGHEMAAGFTIKRENIPAFREAVEAYAQENDEKDASESGLEIDGLIEEPGLLTLENIESLEEMEPFGHCNPRPVFCVEGMKVKYYSEVGGGKHLKLRLSRGGTDYEAIFFSETAKTASVEKDCSVDVAFTPEVNEFRGSRTVQLRVMDIRPSMECRRLGSLWKKLSEGGLTGEEAAALIPQRDEFACVWRYIRGLPRGGAKGDWGLLSARAGISAERFRVCAEVFRELGLALIGGNGDIISISCREASGKVNLEDAPLMKRLREIEG